jgi:hypothetical protein
MSYNHIRAAGTAVVLAAALVACGGGSSDGGAKAKAKPRATHAAKVDCSAKNMSEADWVEHCSEAQGPNGPTTGTTTDLPLGKASPTTGDEGTGVLEMTPTTVVYSTDGAGNEPEHDTFAVVTVKQRPTTAVAAAEVPPISGGGWQWIAPDGQAVDSGDGASFNVVMEGFNAGGPVQPGSFVWDAVVFDLTLAQAKGGVLVYVDGEGAAHRWKVPAGDTGPQVAEVKKLLKF